MISSTYLFVCFRLRSSSLLSGELLAERCRTDDLMPSIPVLCLPLSRVDPNVLGLNVLVYHSILAICLLNIIQYSGGFDTKLGADVYAICPCHMCLCGVMSLKLVQWLSPYCRPSD